MHDRILQVLVDACPHELRFTDIYERVGGPSRSAFNDALQKLVEEQLVLKREISHRFVTYMLNAESYRKKIQTDKEHIADTERKIGRR